MTGSGALVGHDKPQHCGSKARHGGVCKRPAGWGTQHAGEGRCKLHGGNTPIKHGRYSTVRRESIRLLIEKHEADPDPLNVLPELAAARALFQDFIDRYDQWAAALIAWHESYRAGAKPISQDRILALGQLLDEYEALIGTEDMTEKQEGDLKYARETVEALGAATDGKPVQILDVADAYRILETISKMVKRVEDVRAANAVSRADLIRIMTEMGRVVQAHVRDETIQQKIRDGWLTVRL